MPEADIGSMTRLLNVARSGDRAAHEDLCRLAYDELLKLARSRLAREPRVRINKSPESLVHEAWMRVLSTQKQGSWVCRQQFYGYVRRAMWQICVEWIRKNSHRLADQPFADWMIELKQDPAEMVPLDDALEKLATLSPQMARAAQVVRLRHIEERSVKETAAILGVSDRTVEADWTFARAWLHRELDGKGEGKAKS